LPSVGIDPLDSSQLPTPPYPSDDPQVAVGATVSTSEDSTAATEGGAEADNPPGAKLKGVGLLPPTDVAGDSLTKPPGIGGDLPPKNSPSDILTGPPAVGPKVTLPNGETVQMQPGSPYRFDPLNKGDKPIGSMNVGGIQIPVYPGDPSLPGQGLDDPVAVAPPTPANPLTPPTPNPTPGTPPGQILTPPTDLPPQPATPGDTLIGPGTGAGVGATVTLPDGTVVQMPPGSKIRLDPALPGDKPIGYLTINGINIAVYAGDPSLMAVPGVPSQP
jgi:hypothetical protein